MLTECRHRPDLQDGQSQAEQARKLLQLNTGEPKQVSQGHFSPLKRTREVNMEDACLRHQQEAS